ncbi:MAG: hypothetical protein JNM47_06100 [Hyphomonadaceae bacterium]|nr:hypothetical protein [Hyphomonadaceae bacterium]
MQKPFVFAALGGGLLVAALLAAVLVTNSDGANATRADVHAAAGAVEPATVSTTEANAWAETRAKNTREAYEVFLTAFPEGAFADEARLAMVRTETQKAEAPKAAAPATVTRVASTSSAPRRNVRAECQAYVDRTYPEPSKLARAGIGAAAGCGVGAMAGGDDGRNCAVGAVVGGVGGAMTARQRTAKREQEYSSCVANGGPR